jgi:parallel beta-helix repeat protein
LLGALYFSGVANAAVQSTVLSSNLATLSGGGFYLANSDATLYNTTVLRNSARYSGGAAYVDGNSFLSLTGVVVTENNATFMGGVRALPPAEIQDSSSVYSNNVPLFYGNATSYSSNLFLEPYNIVLTRPLPMKLIPSTLIEPGPIVEVKDFYGNTVQADQQTIVYLKTTEDHVEINGQRELIVSRGIAIFESTSISGPVPDSHKDVNRVLFISSSIPTAEVISVSFSFKPCSPGYEPDLYKTKCLPCATGFYNFDGVKCISCKVGGVCNGGSSLLVPDSGNKETFVINR